MVENYFAIGKFRGANGCPMELVEEKKAMENKLLHTMFMAEFSFKCLYKGEKPLSKKDYARVRETHRIIDWKLGILLDTMNEEEYNNMENLLEGLKPFSMLP